MKDKIIEIDVKDAFIGNYNDLHIFDDYLVIQDTYSSDSKYLKVFDKNTFKYVGSIADVGEGPNEIVRIGDVTYNKESRELYVSDYGKLKIYTYNMDSALQDSLYKPRLKMDMNGEKIPAFYRYFSDTLSYGLFIEPIDATNYNETIGKWNMLTGEVKTLARSRPDIKKESSHFNASIKDSVLVRASFRYDLLRIYDLNGNLKHNVYGPKWKLSHGHHYGEIAICKGNILVLYDGTRWEEHNSPKLLHIFSVSGDYLKTLNLGYATVGMVIDEQNHRLIFSFNDEIQFGYLDMDEIL